MRAITSLQAASPRVNVSDVQVGEPGKAVNVAQCRLNGAVSLMQGQKAHAVLSDTELRRLIYFAEPPAATTPAKARFGQLA